MPLALAHAAAAPAQSTQVFILPHGTTSLPAAAAGDLPEAAARYVEKALADDQKLVHLNHFSHHHYFVVLADKPTTAQVAEQLRRAGHTLHGQLKAEKVEEVFIENHSATSNAALLLAEGLALSAYQFEGYKTDEKSQKPASLARVYVVGNGATVAEITELEGLLEGVEFARDLVNAPLNKLNAVQFAERMAEAGDRAGYTTDILDLAKIEALRMGGLLAVNLGSPEPPTFSILEYKPENAQNEKPYVLVGKGVVFDTGGLSLKPTPNSMDMMKCDMAGGAAVAGTLYALAKNQVPLHVIGLVPATDNRPGGLAYAPGDVLTMHSGLTVEVRNTDAEGRLLLADALSFAKRYEPELVIDLATLTGAAVRALGTEASASMGTAEPATLQKLAEAGYAVHERLVEFPLWDEYADHIKSDIADINNLGKGEAGHISAAKFLERFAVGYPWIHLDIAGPAYLTAPESYRGKGGTGVGVRLLYEFLTKQLA
ncbi:leucyl aminopeptidase family protein [Hymenobacter properus]|uniref:Probable cytosol aminopeptidase n=1 Tax=Hymenobacter properus TaxID=2791026 RepID=A0A931BCI5_9BACT|nr:leucyl aminopeptidase [Hymenobacter properus]MBF9140091.1 leucyl aminopeptidase [Hymenobacter properus]MBR7718898.1 leucyl aminopeptidase [Microvirga sp. SRT04]